MRGEGSAGKGGVLESGVEVGLNAVCVAVACGYPRRPAHTSAEGAERCVL